MVHRRASGRPVAVAMRFDGEHFAALPQPLLPWGHPVAMEILSQVLPVYLFQQVLVPGGVELVKGDSPRVSKQLVGKLVNRRFCLFIIKMLNMFGFLSLECF